MSLSTQHAWGPANIDSLLTTTRDAVLKSREYLNDAIFNKITLLSHLNKRNQISKQGGASILVPLLFAKNNSFRAYSGDDVFDTSGVEGLTMALA